MARRKLLQLVSRSLFLFTCVVIIATSSPLRDVNREEIVVNRIEVKPYGKKLQEMSDEKIRIKEEEARLKQALLEEAQRLQAIKEQEAKEEAERIKAEEDKKAEEAKAKAKSTASRGGGRQVTFELTFYTSLPSENGGYSAMANGKSVTSATNAIASNYYKLGTTISLTGLGTYVVQDRGGSSFNSSTRLDVLIPRRDGEGDSAYKTRVRNMGRVKVVGYIFN